MNHIRVLFVISSLLLVACVTATGAAIYYHNLYTYNPKPSTVLKTVQHNSIVYTGFNPNRSEAYSCITQQMSSSGVGMICSSPNGDIVIDCTTTPQTPTEYWC